jgi:hypothetical protein
VIRIPVRLWRLWWNEYSGELGRGAREG